MNTRFLAFDVKAVGDISEYDSMYKSSYSDYAKSTGYDFVEEINSDFKGMKYFDSGNFNHYEHRVFENILDDRNLMSKHFRSCFYRQLFFCDS